MTKSTAIFALALLSLVAKAQVVVTQVDSLKTPNQGRNIWNANDVLLRDSINALLEDGAQTPGWIDDGTGSLILLGALDYSMVPVLVPEARTNRDA